jgi:hypothetical protein
MSESEEKFRSSFRKKRTERLAQTKPTAENILADIDKSFPALPSSSGALSTSSKDTVPEYSARLDWVRDSEKSVKIIPDDSEDTSNCLINDDWIVLTRDTVRAANSRIQLANSRKLRGRDWEAWDNYLESLSPREYHELASSRMDEMVRNHERQKAEFISVYGYEYYAHIYMFKDRVSYEEENENEEEMTGDSRDEDGDGWDSV